MIYVQLYHVVEEGDTMLEICIKYGLNMAKILELNRVYMTRDVNRIQVDELIRIQ